MGYITYRKYSNFVLAPLKFSLIFHEAKTEKKINHCLNGVLQTFRSL